MDQGVAIPRHTQGTTWRLILFCTPADVYASAGISQDKMESQTITVEEMLDELARVRDEGQRLGEEYTRRREEILKPVADQLARLDDEIGAAWDAISTRMAHLEKEIRRVVLAQRKDAYGARLHAVYLSGQRYEFVDEDEAVIVQRYDDDTSHN